MDDRYGLLDTPHLSASALSDWLTCPMLWAGRRGKIDVPPEAPNVPMAIGRAIGAGLEAHHTGNGDEELALLKVWQSDVRPLGGTDTQLAHALDVLGLYGAMNPRVELDACEVLLYASVLGVPVPLIGYVDLLRAGRGSLDHPNLDVVIATADEIHEFKTGLRPWTQERVDESLQVTVYWWAYVQSAACPPAAFTLWWLNLKPPVSVQRFETVRTDKQIREFEAQVQYIWAEMCVAEASGEYASTCSRCAFPEACGREGKREAGPRLVAAGGK